MAAVGLADLGEFLVFICETLKRGDELLGYSLALPPAAKHQEHPCVCQLKTSFSPFWIWYVLFRRVLCLIRKCISISAKSTFSGFGWFRITKKHTHTLLPFYELFYTDPCKTMNKGILFYFCAGDSEVQRTMLELFLKSIKAILKHILEVNM